MLGGIGWIGGLTTDGEGSSEPTGAGLGNVGGTGVSPGGATVFGVDGLNTGGGGGGTGFTNCACAGTSAKAKKTADPAARNFATAIRSKPLLRIAVSCEPMIQCRQQLPFSLASPRGLEPGPQ